jgi:dihydrofolate synthase/folylpolyglutamate synthase
MDRQAAPSGGPTYFEITTAMALLHFARHNAAAAVLEVGLGGRLDATNVCRPAVSVITSIGLDHTEQLGTTLAAIAGEKAGIVKPGVPVVSGVVPSEPRDVIRAVCRRQGCRCIELATDFDFDYEPPRHLEQAAAAGRFRFRMAGGASRNFALALPGRHQAANAAVALAAVEELRRGGWNLPEAAIERALADLNWPARVEVVARRPAVVVDGAHNVASVEALVATLDESFAADRRWLIFAGSQDKDLRGMLARLLPKFDEVLLTRYRNNPRGASPDELARLAAAVDGRPRPLFDDSADAWQSARRQAAPEDLIVIAGSFFLAAELRPLAGGT